MEIIMQTKSIRQSATFNVKPSEVYETIMDSRRHAAFSGAKANINRKVGGKFTAYGDHIEGKNLELVANKKIVQEWRGSDWPKGHYSKVTYTLKAVKGRTKLSFYQSGVPAKNYKGIKSGWTSFYWEPMKKMLNK